MKVNLRSKSVIISFILGAIILVTGVVSISFSVASKKQTASTKEPLVKTEEGNPRAVVTEPEKYIAQAEEAAKNITPSMPVQVSIGSTNFSPAIASSTAPFVVTFKNEDTVKHSVKGVSGKWGSLKDLEPGEAYSQQFDVAGSYDYYDPINPDMRGTIVVE